MNTVYNTVKLVPIPTFKIPQTEKQYYEQILIFIGSYPISLVHIETFLETKTHPIIYNEIYNKLEKGETVVCDMIFTLDKITNI